MKWSEANAYRAKIDRVIAGVDDETALDVQTLFPLWEIGRAYTTGDRVQYNGLLYKCVQGHTSQTDWTPDITPALWVQVFAEEWPEWKRPISAETAYRLNAKVSHNGKHWINVGKDYNEYEPGVWGWDEVTD